MKTIKIQITEEQYNYLNTEAERLTVTVDELIQQLLDIQIDVQKDLEDASDELTVDMWSA